MKPSFFRNSSGIAFPQARPRARIGLLGLVFAFSFASVSSAQCLRDSVQLGQLFKSTGLPALDSKFNVEGDLIYRVFGVAPNMFIFDDGGSPNAYASPQNTQTGYTGTVYFGVGLLRDELWSMRKGEAAVAGIMAHEFAHILQIQRNSRLKGKARELQADFLAGYFLGKKSKIVRTDLRAFAESLFEKGDYNFTSPIHHGTPQERVAALIAGFESASLQLSPAYARGENLFRARGGAPRRDTDDSADDALIEESADAPEEDEESDEDDVDDDEEGNDEQGHPSGFRTLPCGCHGWIQPGAGRRNPSCRSGYEIAVACGGSCPGGGVAWGAICR